MLEHIGPNMPRTPEAADAYLDLARTISSDFDMRLALLPLLTSPDSDDELVARAIDVAGSEIASDFDLRTLLADASGRVGRSTSRPISRSAARPSASNSCSSTAAG